MKEKTKVLIVSLSSLWAASAKALLTSNSHFDLLDTVYGALSALEVIREARPEMVIIDDNVPSAETFRLLRTLKSADHAPYCIVMIPSSRHSVKTLGNGADAVVLRSDSPERLSSAVLAAREHILSTAPWASDRDTT